jgi:hypothetical protein
LISIKDLSKIKCFAENFIATISFLPTFAQDLGNDLRFFIDQRSKFNTLKGKKKIMKKIMMTLAAIAVAATMNAQVYVGGTFNLGFENKLIDQKDPTKTDATGMAFEIKPEIGYNLDDKSSVGIVLGFGITNNTNEMLGNAASAFGKGVKTDKSAIQFGVMPYYRYKFLQFDKVDIFMDAQVGYVYTKLDEWNNSTFTVGVRPGVAFNASDKVSFVAKLGKGLFFESSKDKNVDAVSKFGLNANTLAALEIGMYYNF